LVTVGFYGASDAAWSGYNYIDKDSGNEVISWNDLVSAYFNTTGVNSAVMDGSIERAALAIKSTKTPIDIAIIVMGSYAAIPLINCDRDIAAGHKDFDNTSEQIFNIKGVSIEFKYAPDKDVAKQFGSREEYIQTLNLWKKHLWSAELQSLRYTGALIQLDQYLIANNIPAIYVGRARRVPTWLKLQAGVVYDELYDLNRKFRQTANLPNNISAEGQKELAKVYIKLIKEILSI
jgi:hypothetical protein